MRAGKTALIAAGVGAGLVRSLRALRTSGGNAAAFAALEARVDTIHIAVARIAAQTERLEENALQCVKKEDLAQSLDRVFGQLERGVDARFENQSRSVEALRMMIEQTDELLQRVLDGLDSMAAGGGAAA